MEPIPQPCAEKPAKWNKSRKKKKVIVVCHTCHRIGHKAQVCPQRQLSAQLGLLGSQSPPARSMLAISSRDHGRLNHITTKNAMEAPEVVLGKLEVEGAPIVVLFDSGATYSYVTSKFMQKQTLPTKHWGRSMITSSPLGDVSCNLLCKSVRLKMAGYIFLADLIVLKSDGDIDVILGMDWLTKHKGLISCFPQSVSLEHPGGFRV